MVKTANLPLRLGWHWRFTNNTTYFTSRLDIRIISKYEWAILGTTKSRPLEPPAALDFCLQKKGNTGHLNIAPRLRALAYQLLGYILSASDDTGLKPAAESYGLWNPVLQHPLQHNARQLSRHSKMNKVLNVVFSCDQSRLGDLTADIWDRTNRKEEAWMHTFDRIREAHAHWLDALSRIVRMQPPNP